MKLKLNKGTCSHEEKKKKERKKEKRKKKEKLRTYSNNMHHNISSKDGQNTTTTTTAEHILCECEALAFKRQQILGLGFPSPSEYHEVDLE